MTAFEILLNNFYDSIEKNEPTNNKLATPKNPNELYDAVRQFIEASFLHGQNLSYTQLFSELIDKTSGLFQSSSHESWEKVKYAFIENDLHIIRRDRNKTEIEELKTRLVHSF